MDYMEILEKENINDHNRKRFWKKLEKDIKKHDRKKEKERIKNSTSHKIKS